MEDLNYFFGSQVSSEQDEDFHRHENEHFRMSDGANEVENFNVDTGVFLNPNRKDSFAISSHSKSVDDFVRSFLTVEVGHEVIDSADSSDADCHIVEKKFQNDESDEITVKDCRADERTDSKHSGCLPENGRQHNMQDEIGGIASSTQALKAVPLPLYGNPPLKRAALDEFARFTAASQHTAVLALPSWFFKRS